MEPRDDDIRFDFFEEEPPTREAQPRVRLPRRGGRRTAGGRPPGNRNLTPAFRLLVLTIVLVVLLVVFGLVLQSCASTSKHDSYAHYMAKVATIGHSSESDGNEVATALTTPGAKVADLVQKLDGIAAQEQQNVAAAEKLDPPGPLRPANGQMIEALQLRVSGVQGLAKAFTATAGSKAAGDATVLAQQAERLLASDVVWDDLFQAPARSVLADRGVTGVAPPDSNFVSNQDLISERSMSLVLQRLRGASTGGGTPTGKHGTNLVSVKTTSQGKSTTLSESTVNTVTARPDLAFVVTVHDGGDSQEVGIKVTLTIQKDSGGSAVVKTKTLDVINPGQDKPVTFKGVDVTSFFAQRSHIAVDIAPVQGEATVSNNKGTFPVIFSLG
jgi:hypothetical protein